jgi:outer membrane protein assembly factor BamA
MNKLAFILIFVSALLVGCSTTKSLTNDEVLYRGERVKFKKVAENTSWKISNSSEKFANVYWELWESPNGALLGMPVTIFFPMRLYMYHAFYNEKTKGFNYWMRENFGEAPKTIQYVNPEIRLQKGVSVFEEYGHFGTTGLYKLNYNRKQNKAYLRFYFDVHEAYKYRSIKFETKPQFKELESCINDFELISVLKPTEEFNLYKIRSEKSRLANLLNDSGFYFISEKNILISADTAVGNKMLDLKLAIDNTLPKGFYEPQYLHDVQISMDSVTQPQTPDKFYDWKYGKLKSKVLDSLIDIKSGGKYSLSDTRRTNFLLSELGLFSDPRIEYKIMEGDTLTLRPVITLTPLDATNIGFNIKGNYKNTGYIGPSIGFTFQQRNLFHGAENLTVNGDMYYDFPMGKFKNRVSNSYGFSMRSELSIPLLTTPFKFINHKYSLSKQFYKLNMEFNIRQDYFDLTTINGTYGWKWKSKPNVKHTVGLADVTMSSIKNPTQRFKDLVGSNPLLAVTLVDQFLVGSYYEFNYKKTATNIKRWDVNYTGRVDLSGNVINLLNGIFTSTPNGERKFLGMEYAQFARVTSEIIAKWHISKTHKLVFRNISGVGIALGNSDYMPFIKQYFIGGTNSLRPFSARTIGPGRFLQTDEAEVNQVGDFKLEFNLEYRMPLVWKLNFAVFVDVGNIWLLNPDPNRPGGEVRWDKIFQDSYVTSGVGFRLDLTYLILRLDVATLMHIPLLPRGSRWAWQYDKVIWAPVIGIGYPF